MKKGRWDREINASFDKLQTKLGKNGIEPNTLRTASIPYQDIKYSLCPFCLTKNLTKDFAYLTEKGKTHSGLGQCPKCKQLSQYKTLTRKWDAKSFARFCFDYALTGFWGKAKFDLFKQNLYNLGFEFTQEFWDEYKKLKGDTESKKDFDSNDSYTKTKLEELSRKGLISEDVFNTIPKNGVKEKMPIAKSEVFERFPKISLKTWKHKETKTLKFLDEGKDIKVEPTPTNKEGIVYLYHIQEEKEQYELWIRPNSSLAIGLSPFVPLKDKTFSITKTTGKTLTDTRYTAKELNEK